MCQYIDDVKNLIELAEKRLENAKKLLVNQSGDDNLKSSLRIAIDDTITPLRLAFEEIQE